jgi:hypothetical protein
MSFLAIKLSTIGGDPDAVGSGPFMTDLDLEIFTGTGSNHT